MSIYKGLSRSRSRNDGVCCNAGPPVDRLRCSCMRESGASLPRAAILFGSTDFYSPLYRGPTPQRCSNFACRSARSLSEPKTAPNAPSAHQLCQHTTQSTDRRHLQPADATQACGIDDKSGGPSAVHLMSLGGDAELYPADTAAIRRAVSLNDESSKYDPAFRRYRSSFPFCFLLSRGCFC